MYNLLDNGTESTFFCPFISFNMFLFASCSACISLSAFFVKSVITVFFLQEADRAFVTKRPSELERIAARDSSDLDLSDSDEEAPEDVAVLDDLEKDLEPDVDSSDEEHVHTVPAAPKRAALWKTTDRYGLLFLVPKT